VIESSVFLLRQHLGKEVIEPKVERHLEKITVEVKRSTKTINDLLELARNRPPRPRPTRLSEMVSAAVAAAHLPPTVNVRVEAAENLVAMLDADQINRVLTNLLINASQAMEGRGEILVAVARRPPETQFRVSDRGPGVAPELRHRLFEALFTTKAKGSGLGLALCRRIAEAHGGSIVLESAEPGATFLLVVPDGVPEEGHP
jgi:two-component system, NtrC family, sensor histidine kinase HydH